MNQPVDVQLERGQIGFFSHKNVGCKNSNLFENSQVGTISMAA